MKVNLRQLAAELARADNPKARNADVIAAETMLACLGRKLREGSILQGIAIVYAIIRRGGKTQGKTQGKKANK